MSKVCITIVLATVLITAAAGIAIADTFSGSLTTPNGSDGGINGTGTWWPMTISWNVYQVGDLWRYDYELTSSKKDISHFIIEVSSSFTIQDIVNCNWSSSYMEIGTFKDQGNSNPNMPDPIYGIKFDGYGPDSKHWVISFDSTRAPVWGDFYAKDGTSGDVFNTAWNEGYSRTDPTVAASNGTVDNHILRPDTVSMVPEPASLSLLGMGAASLLFARRRYRA